MKILFKTKDGLNCIEHFPGELGPEIHRAVVRSMLNFDPTNATAAQAIDFQNSQRTYVYCYATPDFVVYEEV